MKSSGARHFRKLEVPVRIGPEASDSVGKAGRVGPHQVGQRPDSATTESAPKRNVRSATAPKPDILSGFTPSEIAKLRARLEDNTSPEPNSGCWLWTGAATTEGYGKIGTGRIIGNTKHTVYVHRLAYELERGPMSPGMTIDHLCRVRCCVNVAHMELVTPQVNSARRPPPPAGEHRRRALKGWATRRKEAA